MPDSTEEIRQSKKQILRLSPAEYHYLKYGTVPEGYIEDGRKRTDKLDNRVKDRLDYLPQRLEILLEDIKLLAEEGLHRTSLSRTDVWVDCWVRLLGISFESHRVEGELVEQLTYQKTTNPIDRSAPERFGEKIGNLLWHLFCLEPPGIELDEMFQNLIWGVIIGVAHQISDDTDEFKLEITKEFKKRAQLESELSIDHSIEAPDKEREQSVYDRIVELLEAEKEVPDSLLEQRPASKIGETASKDSVRPWIIHRVAQLIAEEDSSMSDWVYGVDEVNWSPADNITPELISDLIEEHRLVEQQRLFEMLNNDTERIKEKRGKGPKATQILNCVAEEDDPICSKDIAAQINENKDWSRGVTELGRDLAGYREPDEYPERDIWSNRPILKGSKEGWETTAYGEALKCCLKNQDMWEVQSRHASISDPKLEAAIDDVILS